MLLDLKKHLATQSKNNSYDKYSATTESILSLLPQGVEEQLIGDYQSSFISVKDTKLNQVVKQMDGAYNEFKIDKLYA